MPPSANESEAAWEARILAQERVWREEGTRHTINPLHDEVDVFYLSLPSYEHVVARFSV